MKRSVHSGLAVIKANKPLAVLHEQLLSQFLAPDAPKMAVATVCFKNSVVTIGVTAPFLQSAHTAITREIRGRAAQEAEAANQRKMLLDVMTTAVELLEGRSMDPGVETRRIQFLGGGNN